MTPADKLAAEEARRQFALEVSQDAGAIDVARAALLIAAEEEPARCDVARCLARLDEMGAEARARINWRGGPAVEALNKYLFEELGFAGDQANYYAPRNSLLNYVLERRLGIPITLSVVYMEVGRRAGLEVEGVGMPGHFIARATDEAGRALLVDPFYGKVVDEDECQQRLDTIYGGQVPLGEEHLRAVGPRDILVRVLGNLKGIYVQSRLYRRALAAVERILLLAPLDFEEHRDRGMLLAQLERLAPAIEEVQSYLAAAAPDAPDAESVREQLKKMQIRFSMLN